jgi:hypothetical protein
MPVVNSVVKIQGTKSQEVSTVSVLQSSMLSLSTEATVWKDGFEYVQHTNKENQTVQSKKSGKQIMQTVHE